MKFKIIKRKNSILGRMANAQWSAIIFILLQFLLIKIVPYKWLELSMILFAVGLFANIVFSVFDYEKLNAEIVGDLLFEGESIQIDTERILYREIQKMELYTNYFKGEHRNPGSKSFFGPWNYIGKGNYLKVKCFDHQIFNIEFQILSLHDLKKINEFYAKLLLDEKIALYSHSLHHLPNNIKRTPSFLIYVLNLVNKKVIGKEYSERVLRDKYD